MTTHLHPRTAYLSNEPLRVITTNTEQPQQYLAREILALTKMNWNNTQFDGSEPVTLRAARHCSSVLRYGTTAQPIEPRYSYCENHARSNVVSCKRQAIRRGWWRWREKTIGSAQPRPQA
jgi:hypothetical protein